MPWLKFCVNRILNSNGQRSLTGIAEVKRECDGLGVGEVVDLNSELAHEWRLVKRHYGLGHLVVPADLQKDSKVTMGLKNLEMETSDESIESNKLI